MTNYLSACLLVLANQARVLLLLLLAACLGALFTSANLQPMLRFDWQQVNQIVKV